MERSDKQTLEMLSDQVRDLARMVAHLTESIHQPAKAKDWLSKREACQITGLSLRAINYKLKENQFTHRKAGGRVYLKASELTDFIRKTTVRKSKV